MLSRFAVRRPVAITMIIMVFMLLGIISLTRLPIEFFPELEYPLLFVSSNYPGVGPQEIEKVLTKPLEMAVSRVSGVKKVTSTSSDGSIAIQIEFEWGTSLDKAMKEVRQNIEMLRQDDFLPEDASNPMILQFDMSGMPVAIYGLSGTGRSERYLKKLGEDVFQPNLEKLEGVGSAPVWGGGDREIRISISQKKLVGLGLSLDMVINKLRMENINIGVGSITQNRKYYNVKTIGEYESLEDIQNTIVAMQGGIPLRLRDIAAVRYSPIEEVFFARMNAKTSCAVAVLKQSGANTVAVSRAVRKQMTRLKQVLPDDIEVMEMFDSARFVEDSVNNLSQTAMFGAILAVVVILLFLRNFRAACVVGTAIPLSVLFSFFPLYLMGISLNLISLGGLAIGVGMLVDNSIVVLENIFRHLQEGENRNEAAIKGAGQVMVAIIASTLTTVAVFVPIVFTEGIAKILFGQLAASISFSLGASLVVAITMIPMLASKLLNRASTANLTRSEGGLLEGLRSVYKALLTRLMGFRTRHKVAAFFLSAGFGAVMLAATAGMAVFIGFDFMPKEDNGLMMVSIKYPVGTPLAETDRQVMEIEKYLLSQPVLGIDVEFALGGEAANFEGDAVPNNAMLMVRLRDDRQQTTQEVMADIRDYLKTLGGAKYRVMQMGEMGGQSSYGDVSIKLVGNDFTVLERLALEVEELLRGVEGAKDITSSVEQTIPELQIKLNRDNVARAGLTAMQAGMAIRNMLKGTTTIRVEQFGTEVDVVVRMNEDEIDRIDELMNASITTPMGSSVPVKSLAEINYGQSPGKLHRENQRRAVWVGANKSGRDIRAIVADIKKKVEKMNLPDGYFVEYGGESEQMEDTQKDMALMFLLAVILVYIIMAALFESFTHPFAIILTIPFSVTGAMAGGLIGKLTMDLTITVNFLIGVVMLVGIVVNNAIVFLDYVRQIREEKDITREDALIEAGSIRFRPILLTALTTILGLMPLALGFGAGAEVRAPMALSVIGGLVLSTMLTLVFLPVVYTYVDAFGEWVKRVVMRILHREEAEANTL